MGYGGKKRKEAPDGEEDDYETGEESEDVVSKRSFFERIRVFKIAILVKTSR